MGDTEKNGHTDDIERRIAQLLGVYKLFAGFTDKIHDQMKASNRLFLAMVILMTITVIIFLLTLFCTTFVAPYKVEKTTTKICFVTQPFNDKHDKQDDNSCKPTKENAEREFMQAIIEKLEVHMKIHAPKNTTQNPNTSSPKHEKITYDGVPLDKHDIRILIKILNYFSEYKEGISGDDLESISASPFIIENSFTKLRENHFISKHISLGMMNNDSLYKPLTKAKQFGRENIHLFEQSHD